jgi:hypothetical protein
MGSSRPSCKGGRPWKNFLSRNVPVWLRICSQSVTISSSSPSVLLCRHKSKPIMGRHSILISLGRWVFVMKKIFFAISRIYKAGKKRIRGQSIVEFAILLPLLLMLLSSLIEFGFIVNEYLDLIDTTRETARFLSDNSPFTDPTSKAYRADFYTDGAAEMSNTLDRAGWINLDTSGDDLVISVFSISGDTVVGRYPASFTDTRGGCSGAPNGGDIGWRLFCRQTSKFSSDDINALVGRTSSVPPNNGIVLVEIFYEYHMRLGLPWVAGIVGDTVTLHAYSFDPCPAAEP